MCTHTRAHTEKDKTKAREYCKQQPPLLIADTQTHTHTQAGTYTQRDTLKNLVALLAKTQKGQGGSSKVPTRLT